MRDILFRGKRLQGDNWIEGYFYRSDINERMRKSGKATLIFTPDCDTFIMVPEAHNSFMVHANTVGQYTGLTDKNGVKIYEGDILREPAKNGWEKKNFVGFEVFWHDNDSCDRHIGWQMNRLHFYGSLGGADIYPIAFRPEWTSRMEVIGNIHDNGLEDFDGG